MVALQDFDRARNTDVWLKLGRRPVKEGETAPRLSGFHLGTFEDIVEMIDMKANPPVSTSTYVTSDDGKYYFVFRAGTHDLFHNGIVGAIDELVSRGMYPKRYMDYFIKLLEKDDYTLNEVFQFLAPPNKNRDDQEAMTHGNQLIELLDVCMGGKPRNRITLHVDPLYKFLEVYERGFRRHAEESKKKKKGPPSQIDVSKSVKSKSTSGTRSKHSASSSRVSEGQKSLSVASSKKSGNGSKSTSKPSGGGNAIQPFKVPSANTSGKKLRSPEWHCIRIDPLGSSVKVDPKTNCISPWYASKPDEDKTGEESSPASTSTVQRCKIVLEFLVLESVR